MTSIKLRAVVALFGLALVCAAQAQQAAAPKKAATQTKKAANSSPSAIAAEFEKFRDIMEDASPAELFEAKGEELWKMKRGPKNASLEQCDLGQGRGVVKGAYVRMPRYFADADQVMDAERRIVYCMVTLQGFKEADLAKKPFSSGSHTPDPVSLVTYVAANSRGMKIAVPQKHPREREAFNVGKEIFNYRAGPWDFSCDTCHGESGLRIRTQDLPNLTSKKEAIAAFQSWPGYRMTGGLMHSLQWRLNDCFRQQRFPEPGYVSETISDLMTYLGVNANGHVYKGPGIKR
ncbi:MAG: sulfur oxidation c-type cytochrome SoxA [Betaproteobacteria bacterium]|nr:MAG: sulfur oxidation c-type cytochrome SoxA [Betaproteobacteria bacterium]